MLIPLLLAVGALFALLFIGRVGAARRAMLVERWPAGLFAGAALLAAIRGALWPALALASLAVIVWMLWPRLAQWRRPRTPPNRNDAADAQARALLGVGADATAADIRLAYRTKMAQAHPDRGGSHAEAARLTAARDRLLKTLG